MGYSTRYLGSLRISPPLNPVELEWLTAFDDWHGGPNGDIFGVPMNPRAQWAAAVSESGGGSIGVPRISGVPWGVFDWQPSVFGTHLRWREMEKSNDAEMSIRFIIEHFLGARARARESGHPVFEQFTFDHVLNGVIAGERDDSGELFLLRVSDNVIVHEVVVAGVDPWGWWDVGELECDDCDASPT